MQFTSLDHATKTDEELQALQDMHSSAEQELTQREQQIKDAHKSWLNLNYTQTVLEYLRNELQDIDGSICAQSILSNNEHKLRSLAIHKRNITNLLSRMENPLHEFNINE